MKLKKLFYRAGEGAPQSREERRRRCYLLSLAMEGAGSSDFQPGFLISPVNPEQLFLLWEHLPMALRRLGAGKAWPPHASPSY